jgi:hypothetical protein
MKKISFLFLIYDQIHHEDLWKAFFNGVDPNLYTIHIHYKTQKPLKWFEAHKLKQTIDTKYADYSLILAHNRLLEEALKDADVYKTINLSQSCIPLKPFQTVYDELTSTPCSIFNEAPQNQCERCTSLFPYIRKDKVFKSSNWFILNREHALIATQSHREMEWFRSIESPEEHYFITIIRAKTKSRTIITTQNECESATTFTNWEGYDYKYVHNYGLKRYHDISFEELTHLLKAPCLFGRKFEQGCTVAGAIPLDAYLPAFISKMSF